MKRNKMLLLFPLLILTGCNRQLIDFELDEFSKAHLISEKRCVTIKKWNNYSDGDMVQIMLTDGTKILGHSNEIVLISGTCPYCEGE